MTPVKIQLLLWAEPVLSAGRKRHITKNTWAKSCKYADIILKKCTGEKQIISHNGTMNMYKYTRNYRKVETDGFAIF